MASNSTVFIIAAIIILHFIVGIGWLLYKIFKTKRPQDTEE